MTWVGARDTCVSKKMCENIVHEASWSQDYNSHCHSFTLGMAIIIIVAMSILNIVMKMTMNGVIVVSV